MISADGGIDITVRIDGGLIRHVGIANRRPRGAGLCFRDLPLAELPATVTRLFSICRMAQGMAAVAALEAAAGVTAAPAQGTARRLLLLAETVLERSVQTCLHWPALLGEAPLVAPLKSLRTAFADLHRDLFPEGDWLRPGGGRLAPAPQALSRRLEAGAEALRLTGALAGRLRRKVADDGLGDFGAAEIGPLPDLPAELLERRLAADDSFAARPDWLGLPCFTGPLARRPLFGTGLLAHLMAAEIDLAASLAEMRDSVAALCQHDGQAIALDGVSGVGLGVVEAARGRLVHRLQAEEGRVGDYRMVAPTEWNFHPEGLLGQGLTGRPAPADAEFALRLLITAIDPCVDFTLTVHHA